MALLLFEGFETRQTSDLADEKYSSVVGTSMTTGRLHGTALDSGTWRSYGVAETPTTSFIGVGIKVTNTGSESIIELRDASGAAQVYLRTNTTAEPNSYVLEVLLGDTSAVLLTSDPILVTGGWLYVEWSVTLNTGSGGSAELRPQGYTTKTTSGVTTSSSGTQASFIEFTATSNVVHAIDDIYWCSNSGAAPTNTFLGPVTTEGVFPNVDDSIEWTPKTAGASHPQVNDGASNDDDVTYVSTNVTNGQTDLFTVTTLSVVDGNILGVEVATREALESSGSQGMNHVFVDTTADSQSSATYTVNTTPDYFGHYTLWALRPTDSSAFTVADINTGSFGYETTT